MCVCVYVCEREGEREMRDRQHPLTERRLPGYMVPKACEVPDCVGTACSSPQEPHVDIKCESTNNT